MNRNKKRILSVILCIALITAAVLLTAGCNGGAPSGTAASINLDDIPSDVTVKGTGSTAFYFNVTDADGTVTKFLIKTDKKIVADALLELELMTAKPGNPGMYVTSVNGITADWETEMAYWAFYVGDAYATKGVDATEIVAGSTYAFKKTVSN